MAAGKPAFKNPNVHVIMEDGAEWDVQTLNPDILKYERNQAKYKWPGPSQSPLTWMTFIAWAASQREGLLPATVGWDVFQETCLEVSNPAGNVAADPTPPGPDID
jgi:hypothetical protein